MEEFWTKYGRLKGISSIEFYTEGLIKECKLNEYSEINTIYGNLVPQYDEAEVRRKYKRSLSFYENGEVKRIFPLNGKITAYWTEQNEYKLAEEFNFNFEFGVFKKKIIGINFYESGSVKSLTLWPRDFIDMVTPCGIIETRIGFSLYPNGAIRSCEPRKHTLINTIIGELHAFDLGAIGLNGDRNSLNFNEDGTVKSLRTSTDKITIKGIDGQLKVHEPGVRPNNFNNLIMDVIPLKIEFYEGKIKIDDNEYSLINNFFHIDKFERSFLLKVKKE
ncbi:MAG TPA: hypothetical protein VIM70_04390 [Clostridium sp.]|uniref:hypothetical protein n=1 Tax=Clostridium sp. TaxID=1506 RepID=UPI002F92F73B